MALRTLLAICCIIGLICMTAAWASPGAGDKRGEKLMAHKTMEETLSQHAASLLAIPGVVGVAQGQCDKRPCLKVYVIKKTPELEQKIPATLEGYPVVIEESGEIRALPEKSRERQNQ
jgi:hypothetical protein